MNLTPMSRDSGSDAAWSPTSADMDIDEEEVASPDHVGRGGRGRGDRGRGNRGRGNRGRGARGAGRGSASSRGRGISQSSPTNT